LLPDYITVSNAPYSINRVSHVLAGKTEHIAYAYQRVQTIHED